MSNTLISLVFHNHQPVGNFGEVFVRGYDDCYRPLLDLIAQFPRVKVGLHHSGPLLEWLEAERPQYLDDLARLVKAGQVEPLGAGFYEPMLAVLPAHDALGQLELMQRFCRDRLGQAPTGLWLTERVWEPSLAERIAKAGLKYTLLDDSHFRAAGMTGALAGAYVTEQAGHALALFPIDQQLRYAIPFKVVPEAIADIKRRGDEAAAAGRPRVLTYGDDGEKFGMWPGTHEWVWKKGWLKDFFTAISDEGSGVKSILPAEALRQHPPDGKVYVPTASYAEMGEWALPAEAQVTLHRLQDELKHRQPELAGALAPFVRGGIWQAFMARYPEADTMHKKMVWASRAVADAEQKAPRDPRLEQARRALYRGQCNCAYWHGLFGGLYLNYLRHAVFAGLIEAQNVAESILRDYGASPELSTKVVDFDADFRDEVVLASPYLWLTVDPDQGGSVVELDVKVRNFNLLNVLSRHAEGYHDKIREALAKKKDQPHAQHDGPKSIHDLAEVKDPNLGELLVVDRHRRALFVERFLAAGESPLDLERDPGRDQGDLGGKHFELLGAEDGRVRLAREGSVGGKRVRVEKTITLTGGRLSCTWSLSLAEPGQHTVRFAPEACMTLLAGNDLSRRFHAEGLADADAHLGSRGALPDPARVGISDEWSGIKVDLAAEPRPESLWRAPLETASQSESGFERTYQGTALSPVWQLELGATPQQVTLTLEVGTRA